MIQRKDFLHGRSSVTAMFLLLFLVIFSACKKPEDSIGAAIQPEDELLNLFQTDTLSLNVSVVKEDSLRTDELSLGLIGNYIDPKIGQTKASIHTQIRLSAADVDFGTNAVLDSAVLTLIYADIFYGKLAPQRFSVKEISEDFYLDSTYYSNRSFATFEEELTSAGSAIQEFNVEDLVYLADGDSLPPHLRLRLSEEFGNRMMNLPPEAYLDNETFVEIFKGLKISSLSEDGSVVPVDLLSGNSRVRLFYHNDDAEDLRYDFNINTQCARTTLLEHDYQNNLAGLNDLESIDGSFSAFVQGGSSVKTRIDLPNIYDFNELGSFAINRAELVVPVNNPNNFRYPIQSQLFVLSENNEGEAVALPDQLGNGVNIGGTYNSSREAYVFNISRFIQRLLTGEQDQNVLFLVSNNASVSVNRVELNGPELENGIRLILTYSE